MREHYLAQFDRVWIDCLNGDKYKTGKLTPEGEPDPSIFSTEFNREGIQVGTAIALLVRRTKSRGTEAVAFRDLWGKTKRSELLEEAETWLSTRISRVAPRFTTRPAVPAFRSRERLSFVALSARSIPGVIPRRQDKPR